MPPRTPASSKERHCIPGDSGRRREYGFVYTKQLQRFWQRSCDKGDGHRPAEPGADFSLDPLAANALAPGKKSYHTIIPGFLTKDGKALGPFGVMGAYMQPQGHVQVVSNMIDFGMNPQQALDAPRWQWIEGNKINVESGFNTEIARALSKRGHDVRVSLQTASFGRGQIILRADNGTLVGATEGRAGGNIAII
jgi:gamma-glutamyltranspeptidase/glutathione hydrolase